MTFSLLSTSLGTWDTSEEGENHGENHGEKHEKVWETMRKHENIMGNMGRYEKPGEKYMEFSLVMGVQPVLIHFIFGFSMKSTIQLLG